MAPAESRVAMPERRWGCRRGTLMRPLGSPNTKCEVISSNNFEDMLDRMPKIVAVSWHRPRSFLVWKLFVCPLDISHTKSRTKFEVSSSSSFGDIDAAMTHDLEQPLNRGQGTNRFLIYDFL